MNEKVEEMTQLRSDAAYLVNSRIVAESFDDETVLIDVDKGIYFSMQGTAAAVWRAFETPQVRAAACAELTADLAEPERETVARLIQELAERNLIVEAEATPPAAMRGLSRFAATSFVLPVLGVFTDLADLIAIDPVHEVDDQAGWPVRPASDSGQA